MKIIRHSEKVKPAFTENGKTYYSRETERKVFFILTIIMMIAGILYKFGII